MLPNGMFLPQYITGQTMRERFDKYAVEYARFVNDNQPADALLWSVVGMQYKNIGEVDGFIGEKKKRREIMDVVDIPVKKTEAVRGGSKESGSKGKAPAVQSGVHAPDKGIPAASGPQYKYSTPIEDPKIAKGVIEQALDVKIELSQ